MSNTSEGAKDSTINAIFCRLEEWRHLPSYRLEPRADIFFALFLPEVLGKALDVRINPILIPEFPIKKPSDNKSSKVDYLALQQGSTDSVPKQAFLVELKTDMASRRSEQDAVMDYAVERGLKQLIRDVKVICNASQHKRKYAHLLYHLKSLNLVCYGGEDERELYEKALSGNYDIFNKVEPASWLSDGRPKLRSVYIQPEPPPTVVDFKTFASILEEGQEAKDFRRLFACYLRKWACTKAGDSNPLLSP